MIYLQLFFSFLQIGAVVIVLCYLVLRLLLTLVREKGGH